MSNIKLQETTVDECIQTTLRIFRTRFGGEGSSLDLANYIRYNPRFLISVPLPELTPPEHRWHIYDTVTKMIYGEATGMVEQDAAGERISLQAAEYECFVFTVGAQDTTAAFMSAFVDHVLRNPAVKQRLLEEIDNFDGRGRLSFPVVRYEETTAMPYFMACCQEVLRVSPSVSMILPRYVSPGGIAVGDVTVQDHVEISANPFVIHRSQNVFGQDADAFNPDRWLDDPERVRTMKKYFFAFGYGSRKCIGKNLAVFEAQKFFVQVLQTIAP
ncbi:MAG: hypothetical protein Q9177_001584 [Variospora cf. flavescens]